ncbi:hypothetical protein GCM10010208_29150 [Actinomadura livida]|nr:hypothetical protein GCM10010208_29150 [Actinomadura livida]
MKGRASGQGRVYQAGGDMRLFTLAVPPSIRTPVLVALVLALLVGGGWVLVKWVRPLFAPAYKTQFLIDSSLASGGPAAVADSLRTAVGNAADDDALALRSFGGECGVSENTRQLVGFGTGNREEISQAAGEVRWGGRPTLVRGVVEAVDDFSKRLAWGAGQHGTRVNRIIVVTRHGTDACEQDPAVVQREIHDRLESAGLKVDFKVIGYQVPEAERERLRQISAGIRGDAPVFAADPARLTAALEWFTNTQPVLQEARKVTDVLNAAVGQVEAARAAIEDGRLDFADDQLDRAGAADIGAALEALKHRATTPQARDIHRKARRLYSQQRRVVQSGRDLLEASRDGRSRDGEFAAYRAAVVTYNQQADALKRALDALRATAPGG